MEPFSFPTLPLFLNFFNFFFLQLISWLNKTELLIFRFLVSKGSPTSVVFMLPRLSHNTNCCYARKNILFHTHISANYNASLFPVQGMKSFFYQLGFSYTATTSFKILLERIIPSSGYPQHIVQIFNHHINLPFIISFLCLSPPSLPDCIAPWW